MPLTAGTPRATARAEVASRPNASKPSATTTMPERPSSARPRSASSVIEMTMRYAHLNPDVRRDAAKLLDVRETVRLTWTTARAQGASVGSPQPSMTSSRHRERPGS